MTDGVAAGDHGDSSIFQQIHDRDVRPWLDLVDELRSHGVSQDLPLPQIAVMGDQSCGKSSVLEAISGIPFPRGSGLVTRCATQLIMKSAAKGSPWKATASIPEQHRGRRSRGFGGGTPSAATLSATAPEELTKIISDLQNSLTSGDTGAFSTETISIQVQAPGLPDLTLIDLPGIVRTATKGQRTTVMGEVNALIQKYLEQDRTIILAVVPANQDVATVDILERAKIVDPEGDRTIGVLTKPDLIGPGNEDEAAAVLKNIRKPLKLGYVMVKCRSQRDIDQGMDNKEALTAETAFFRQQPVFKSMPSSSFGIPNLTRRLTQLLVSRIKASLPHIKWEIQSQLVQADAQLKPMVKGVPQTTAECHTSLMKIVSDYCRLLRQSARGYYRDDILSAKPPLRLHAANQSIFRQLHQSIADTVPGFNDMGFGDRLGREIAALRGREMPGFLNHQVFYGFMIQNVETWRPAVESCRTKCANAALTVTSLLVETLAIQFPRLCSAVRDAISALIEQLAEEVSVRVDEIFQKESDPFTTNEGMLEVINTIRFRHFDKAVEDSMDAAGESPENMEALKTAVMEKLGEWYMRNHGVGTMANVEDMCTLLQAYWNVATKRLVDNVCMTMEQDFVVNLLGKVESELFLLTNRYTDVEELFIEDTSVMEKRRSLQAKKQRLLKGLETLMRMAPDVVAQRPGDLEDDWTATDGSDSAALLQQGNGRASGVRDDLAGMRARYEQAELIAQAEGRSSRPDWGSTAWSRPASSYPATTNPPAPGMGPKPTSGSGGVSTMTSTSAVQQPDHYNLPVRPQRQGNFGASGTGPGADAAEPLSRPRPGAQEPAAAAASGASVARGRSSADDQRNSSSAGGSTANSAQSEQEILVGRLMDMGFPRGKVEEALIACGGDPDEAASRLMSQGETGNANGRGLSNDASGISGGSGASRSPSMPSRSVRGLPAEFSRQSGHPATSSSARSTHFFGGSSGTSSGGGSSGRSPPTLSSMYGNTAADDGGLSDFLGTSSSQAQGRSAGATSGRARGEGDRFGLFSTPSSGGTSSRLAQSTSRYGTLFGDEEKKEGSGVRRRTNPSALFEDGDQ